MGVKQESYFEWQQYKFGWIVAKTQDHADQLDFITAFTVAELGEMLPIDIDIYKQVKGWQVAVTVRRQEGEGDDLLHFEEFAETEADARAKMLIYLIENKFIAGFEHKHTWDIHKCTTCGIDGNYNELCASKWCKCKE